MSGLFSKIQTSSTFLEAGIHENCVIASYKPYDDSLKNKQNFIEFIKLDDDDKEIGRRTISWFQFDHNGDFVVQNMQELMVQLVGILESLYPRKEVFQKFKPFRNTDIETADDVADQIKRRSELKTIFENVHEDLETLLAPAIEAYENGDYSNKVRLKLILKNGYTNPPNYGNFVESMDIPAKDSNLKLSIPEQKEIDKAKATLENEKSSGPKREEADGDEEKPKLGKLDSMDFDNIDSDVLTGEL